MLGYGTRQDVMAVAGILFISRRRIIPQSGHHLLAAQSPSQVFEQLKQPQEGWSKL
jgi:hypothetical protein